MEGSLLTSTAKNWGAAKALHKLKAVRGASRPPGRSNFRISRSTACGSRLVSCTVRRGHNAENTVATGSRAPPKPH